MFVYVGSFAYQGSEGITICKFCPETGLVEPVQTVFEEVNAGSLVKRRDILYATDEQWDSGEEGGGRVFTFQADPENGLLTELGHTDTMAANTSNVTFDVDGKYMIVTHFAIGMPTIKVVADESGQYHTQKVFPDTITSLYRMNTDGTPGKLCDVYVHPPVSFIHKAIRWGNCNQFAYCNLGADEVGFFHIDYEKEKLAMDGAVRCGRGTGPRHAVFHKTLPYLYLNYERNGVITRISCEEGNRKLVDDISVVPEDTVMDPHCNQSEILLSGDGTRLYNLMRGLGLLNVLEVSMDTGKLKLLQTIQTESKVARGACFSPDGKYLLVACNDTENIVSYKVNEDGLLKECAVSGHIPHPASLAF
ncbi:MAG: lactonase family protein [Lachnospiraceae bacterium]|nr:lactonase family protein [Lachnospiraceae bacterium]